MKKANNSSLVLILQMENNVMVNGISTEQNQIMDIANHASKKKISQNQELRKILILISYLIVKELANRKVCKFKRLITVKLDIVKDVMMI